MLPTLTHEEILRYSRHLLIPEVGLEGQRKLQGRLGAGDRHRRAGLAGGAVPGGGGRRAHRAGGLRRGRFLQPAAPGDPRHVHARQAQGRSRPASACSTSTRTSRWTSTTSRSPPTMPCASPSRYDIIIDGTDNFPTRYLTNDVCVLLGKPNVYGSIFRFDGQVSVFDAQRRPVLPLPVPRAAAARAGALLRRGRRAGRAARHDRHAPGDRGAQADPGHRRRR